MGLDHQVFNALLGNRHPALLIGVRQSLKLVWESRRETSTPFGEAFQHSVHFWANPHANFDKR